MKRTALIVSMFICMNGFLDIGYGAEMINMNGWQVNVGLDERFRQEYKRDFDFNENAADNGNLFFNRVLLNVGGKYKDACEVFLEGLDARVGSQHLKKTAQKDEFDLHQAYGKTKLSKSLTVKFGRQKLDYGKGRLVAAPSWSNLINAFDALVFRYAKGGLSVDTFGGYRVKYAEGKFNSSYKSERLDGIYMSYRQTEKAPLLETYLFYQFDETNAVVGQVRRYTTGARLAGNLPAGFTYDVEAPLQFGEYGTKDINTYAFHADVTKTMPWTWKPKVGMEFNLASGDRDTSDNKNGTFIPVYQSTHAPYGIMDFFRWQNMREIAGYINGTPLTKLQCTIGTNVFWLDSIHDSWYNSGGSKIRTTTKEVSSFAGTEASIVAKYSFTKKIILEAGYAQFFTGGFLKDTGTDDDADWVYSMVNFKL